MLPTVYFPELRLDKDFVPAYPASNIEDTAAASRHAPCEMLRIENDAGPHATRRRRPKYEPTVIDA